MENNSSNSFFLSPTNKNKFSSIISSLNPIGLKVLNPAILLAQIACLLIFLICLRMKFHLIFLTSIISLFLWVYFHQSWKLSKSFQYISSTTTTIVQYLFYQILKKSLEKLVYNRITKLLNNNNLIYLFSVWFLT